MFRVCKDCGTPAIFVNKEAVDDKVGPEITTLTHEKIYACPNPNCDTVYFNNEIHLKKADLNVPIFFKDSSDDVPICYCSKLTRGEIKNAVSKGYKTIAQIQEFTGKNLTGNCKEKNPIGQCCRNIFLYEIEKASGESPLGFTFKPCSCCS